MLELWNNFISNIDFNYIEMVIWIFFTYSFAGWVMESVGGILVVKKFVNRGFLIGPLCPVYGTGVALITVFLSKYSNDFFALFILATVFCGVLEYLTGYIMEKLFNARWWDYSNRRFNLNGRVCLENLCLFGIAGTTILCIVNPFLTGLYSQIPDTIRHIITGIVLVLFAIDFIISFKIIFSFKDETYKKMDNTEEISNRVKDKAEDLIMQAESDAIHSIRKLTVKGMRFQRKIKYTRKHLKNAREYSLKELLARIDKDREELKRRLAEEKAKFDEQLKLKKLEIEGRQQLSKARFEAKMQNIQKNSKERTDRTIRHIKLSSEEFSKQVKNRFGEKSLLNRRLINAFPGMKVNKPKEKNTDNEN